MIWALQRLANLQQQGKLGLFSVGFKDSRIYTASIGEPDHPETAYSFPLGTTCWMVYLDFGDYYPKVAGATLEEAANKAVAVAERELEELKEQEEKSGGEPGAGTEGRAPDSR